jgi:hypothetical protein
MIDSQKHFIIKSYIAWSSSTSFPSPASLMFHFGTVSAAPATPIFHFGAVPAHGGLHCLQFPMGKCISPSVSW